MNKPNPIYRVSIPEYPFRTWVDFKDFLMAFKSSWLWMRQWNYSIVEFTIDTKATPALKNRRRNILIAYGIKSQN